MSILPSSLKSMLPQTLMGRSLVILVAPVVLIQVIATIVFLDNHWERMTKRLAFSVAGEVAIIAEQLERDNATSERLQRLYPILAQQLDLILAFEPNALLETATPPRGVWGEIIVAPLVEQLEHKLQRPHTVYVDLEEKFVEISVQLETGVLRAIVPERRLFSSSGYVFLLWLIGSSLFLLVVAILFMRNQIRPIRRLAVAAARMGKGREIPASFRPSGAREVRQAAEAFETMQRRLRRQVEQRTAMLAGISHDLRTPLTRLKLQLSMLGETDDTRAMANDIAEMEHMITAYLEFTRSEKGETPTAIRIGEELNDIIAALPQSDNTHIEIVSEENPLLAVQPVNFRRCIENILGNAARYASKVSVAIDDTEDRVTIIIEDNGPGIPEDQYEAVLRPFVRLDEARGSETGGAGLGLSIASDIMLAHGGRLTLSESPDGGLSVRLGFPK